MLYWTLYNQFGFNSQQCRNYKGFKTKCLNTAFYKYTVQGDYEVYASLNGKHYYWYSKFTSVCLWRFIPSVLLSAGCTVAWCGGSRGCVSGSWFPEAGAGRGTRSLTSLSSSRRLVPLTSGRRWLWEAHTRTTLITMYIYKLSVM